MNRPSVRSIFRCTRFAILSVIALTCLAACSQPAPKPGNPSPLSSPLGALKSPVVLPTVMASSGSFQLTVLHTNDTWGYLLPCG